MSGVVEWATASGPPNWVFVLAVLTSPVVWSRWAVQFARERFGFPPRVKKKE